MFSSFEPRHEKTSVLVSDLFRHKPGCTATENGYRLHISNLESRDSSENQGADQLRGYPEADLRFCFRICKSWFSRDAARLPIKISQFCGEI